MDADRNYACIREPNSLYSPMREMSLQRPARNVLKQAAALGKKKFRDAEQRVLVEGILPLEEALKSTFRIREIFVLGELFRSGRLPALPDSVREGGDIPLYEVTAQELKRLSCEQSPQGVVAVAEKKRYYPAQLRGNILVLDRIRDPGNAGTLFRLAHWFGLGGIVMMKGSVDAGNPKVIRASMGSFFHVPYCELQELPEELLDGRELLLSKAHGGTDISRIKSDRPPDFMLVIGNESRGVSAELGRYAHRDITLPSLGGAESLNAATAAAAILAQLLY